MKLQRIFTCITGAFFAVGFAASQAGAGTGPPECQLIIEINALRAQAPSVSIPGTRNVTAKARIEKGSAPDGTTIDVQLKIEAKDGVDGPVIDTQRSFDIRLGVGRGGQGDKLLMNLPQCNSGTIAFVAKFFGPEADGDLCETTRTILKTCK